ncbi:MAG TPA: nitrilase-related carbon-nitrogen hydrolase [Puia sp.]|nr:nitrilase-related carbon-nitrogen hydrolase [Puia sp.]
MEQLSSHTPAFNGISKTASSKSLAFGLLVAASVSSILSSPKWGMALFAWMAPVFYLYFFRLSNVKKKMLLALPVMVFSSLTGMLDVVPFPLPVLLAFAILEGIKMLVIYRTDQLIAGKTNHFLSTLFFPAASVSFAFLSSKMGGGVWWSVANTQFSFKWLIQLASVTGLWGISFMIYWFASVAVWALKNRNSKRSSAKGLMIFGSAMILALSFGAFRYHVIDSGQHRVRVAGVTFPMLGFLENLYRDYSGEQVCIDPKIAVGSAALRKVNQAQLPFVESADTIRFRRGYAALNQAIDSLFKLSQRAADSGASIIIWSEANAIVFGFDERSLVARGKNFAAKNKVYLQMAMAVIHPGKITAGSKFLENEALLIGPEGQLLNTFHKNNPVPMAEASVPGDGLIPQASTAYGKLSTSICYDADFPVQMRQLGRQHSDVLLLPSGDWYAISPYHSYMAIFRGIENGNSVIRQASGGLSLASDYRGKIHASLDYYQPGEKFWVANVPFGHVQTLYAVIGDAFAYGCVAVAMAGWILMGLSAMRRRRHVLSVQSPAQALA